MTWSRVQRIGTWFGFVVAAALLLTLHRTMNPTVFGLIRVGLLLLVVLRWQRVVDRLVASGAVHPLRRVSALAFRWRFLVLVATLELLVIQQLPALLVGAIGD